MSDKVDINFMGLAANDGPDGPGTAIKKFLKGVFHLLTDTWPEGVTPKTAVSHVLRHPTGHYTLLTYPGTAAEGLREVRRHNSDLMENNMKQSDVVFLNGALLEKFGLTFVGEILKHRWNHEKELVLSLPSHAAYGPDDIRLFRNLVQSSNVVMGSDEEFCRLYKIDITTRPIDDDVIKKIVAAKIQAAFAEKVLQNNGMPCPQKQVAFITRGNKPALLVIAGHDEPIEVPIVNAPLNNVLGAGDTAFAGFLAGYLKGLDHETSAKIAMGLAAEKVRQTSTEPYLVDPKMSLRAIFRGPGADGIKLARAWNGVAAQR
jgi:sugar/nucleoside kinase (ribokinase family)